MLTLNNEQRKLIKNGDTETLLEVLKDSEAALTISLKNVIDIDQLRMAQGASKVVDKLINILEST